MTVQDAKKVELEHYRRETYVVLRDLYGNHTPNFELLKEKVKKCKTMAEISNILVYGRVNLL